MAHQPIKPTTYAIVYLALLGLTATTVYIAYNQKQLGVEKIEIPVALGIAGTKTLLVALIFMHMIHSSKLTWLAMACGIVFLVAMVAITLSDYWTRGWLVPRLGPGWLW